MVFCFPLLGHRADLKNVGAFAFLLSSGMLFTMIIQFIALLQPLSPLPFAFRRKLLMLWLSPFVCLWSFTVVFGAKVWGKAVTKLNWSVVFVPSYLFSITFSLWMTAAKPVFGAATAMLSIPFILTEVLMGLYLDNIFGAHLPLFVLSVPVLIFTIVVARWYRFLPFMCDGSFPVLDTTKRLAICFTRLKALKSKLLRTRPSVNGPADANAQGGSTTVVDITAPEQQDGQSLSKQEDGQKPSVEEGKEQVTALEQKEGQQTSFQQEKGQAATTEQEKESVSVTTLEEGPLPAAKEPAIEV